MGSIYLDKYFIGVELIGQELYGASNEKENAWKEKSYHTKIHHYDYVQGKWRESAYMNSACSAYRDGLFYGWLLHGKIIALRPTGETKDILDLQEDILVSDYKTLPDSPSHLLRTSDGTFIFYDENAKAIRAITPNPNYVEPDPTTELISVANQLLVGTWKSEDGIYIMEASLGQAPGFYTIKITGGTSAQTATTITYDAELNTEDEIIKCFNGKRVDSSRFSEDIIYDGTGEAEIPYLSEDYLTFECHTAQNLEDLFEASVDFYKVTA